MEPKPPLHKLPWSGLFGFPFISLSNFEPLCQAIEHYVAQKPPWPHLPLVITPNADQLRLMSRPALQTLRRQLEQAAFVTPDGMPVVWLSKLMGRPLEARLTGADLFLALWPRLAASQARVLMVLSRPELGASFVQENPNAHIYCPPFFEVTDHEGLAAESLRIAGEAVKHGADYIFYGISFPKQERLALGTIAALKETPLHHSLHFLIGATFEFYAGLKPRAPLWMQNNGLEWLFRLGSEPGRLWRRYLLGNLEFVFVALKELWRSKYSKNHRS